MSETFKLTRAEIARVFDTPRAIRAFEQMQETVAASEQVVTAQLGDTGALHLDCHDSDDLPADIGEQAIRAGGEVVVVPAERMPTRSGIAAIFRF